MRGEIVVLKSGGPRMTVGEKLQPGTDIYRCQWFDKISKQYREQNFDSSTFRRCNADELKQPDPFWGDDINMLG